MCKISAQYVKACRKKVRKTGGRRPGRTESRMDGHAPDGHHHTIIRPVWRSIKSRKFTAEIWWLYFPIISQLSKIRNRSVKCNILYIYTLTCELCPSWTLLWLESNFSSSLIPIPSISFKRVDSTLSWTLRWLEESPLFPIMESTSSKNIIEGAPALALWKICNNKISLSVTEYQIHVQFCTTVLGLPVLSFICKFFKIFTS